MKPVGAPPSAANRAATSLANSSEKTLPTHLFAKVSRLRTGGMTTFFNAELPSSLRDFGVWGHPMARGQNGQEVSSVPLLWPDLDLEE